MPEKKCVNCENMDFCAMYISLTKIAFILNNNIDRNVSGQTGFDMMVYTMAHDCKRFSAFKEGV